jgi:hypothetical protein
MKVKTKLKAGDGGNGLCQGGTGGAFIPCTPPRHGGGGDGGGTGPITVS